VRKVLLDGVGFVVCALACGSVTAVAQTPPTCAQLNTDPAHGLAADPTVIQRSTTFVPASGGNSAYCRVDFTVSERGGPEFGYAAGEIQRIVLRVGLPANTSDGGTGGGPDGQGAWNGKVHNLGGGGLLGAVGPVTLATNSRYVGSSTDGGHTGTATDFGVIQDAHQLNVGKIEDFSVESVRLQYQWALRLAKSYYGKPAIRNYWDGCSTGGRHGLVLASRFGDDFDGFLVGAPPTNFSRMSSAASWRAWVNKDIAGGSVTAQKLSAAIARMIAACDDQDGVVDGILGEPRTCRASAALNICGQPGAPTDGSCLTNAEALAIDMAVDGPRNDLGHKVWAAFDRASTANMTVGTSGIGASGIFAWANKDMTFDWRTRPLSDWDDLHELVTNTVGSVTNSDIERDRSRFRFRSFGVSD
jgi:Tannase and feruloyl esterase